MGAATWGDLFSCLFDWNGKQGDLVPGQCLTEWLLLVQCDYDDVDRFYIDQEVIGG